MLDISDTTPLKDLKRGAAGVIDDLPELLGPRSSLQLSVEAVVLLLGHDLLFHLLRGHLAIVLCNECLLHRFRFIFFFHGSRVGNALIFVHLVVLR